MNISFFRVIFNFNFRMLWLGQIISQISMNILTFVLAIEVYRLTLSNTAVSLMMLTFGVPAILFGVMFGGIVDDFDKRKILIFCNLSRVAVLFLFYLFSGYLFMLYFFAVFISIITQLFIPAEAPTIPALVKKNDLLSANSLFTSTFYLSIILGSLSAGQLLRTLGSRNIYLVMAFFMLTAAIFIWQLPELKVRKKNKFKLNFQNLINPIKEGFAFFHNHPRIRQSLYLLTFSQALIATLAVLAPGFADKILNIAVEDVSITVMGPAAAGLIFGAMLVSFISSKFLRGTVILTGILATGAALIFLSLLSPINFHGMIYWIAFLLFVIGVSNSLINVPSATILQEETDENLRGRIYGILTSLTGGMSILPVLFSGIMADAVGTARALLTIGTAVTAMGIYYLFRRI